MLLTTPKRIILAIGLPLLAGTACWLGLMVVGRKIETPAPIPVLAPPTARAPQTTTPVAARAPIVPTAVPVREEGSAPISNTVTDSVAYGMSLAQAGDTASLDKLFQLLEQTSDATQREALVQCFSCISSPYARMSLLDRLRSGGDLDEYVILAAETGLAAIGHLGFVDEVPSLMSESKNEEFQYRLQVAISLVTNPACVYSVAKTATYGLLAGQPDLAGAATCALANMGTPEAEVQLVILAGMPDFPPDCCEVLQRLHSQEALPPLRALAEGKLPSASAAAREAAHEALSRYPKELIAPPSP